MTYIGFPTVSLVFMSIFLCIYYSKKRINLFENKVVISMMILNVIGLLLELGCYLVLVGLKIENTFLGMIILKSYVAYIPVFNWILTGYIFLVTSSHYGNVDLDVKKYFYRILTIFLPMTIVLVFVCFFTRLHYSNDYPKFYTYFNK